MVVMVTQDRVVFSAGKLYCQKQLKWWVCVMYCTTIKTACKRKKGGREGGPQAGGGSTFLNKVLEDPTELRVLVDVAKVREGLHHLPLLEGEDRAVLLPTSPQSPAMHTLPTPLDRTGPRPALAWALLP
jgi:hypothetical protein